MDSKVEGEKVILIETSKVIKDFLKKKIE